MQISNTYLIKHYIEFVNATVTTKIWLEIVNSNSLILSKMFKGETRIINIKFNEDGLKYFYFTNCQTAVLSGVYIAYTLLYTRSRLQSRKIKIF
jgi:hypothetical protein